MLPEEAIQRNDHQCAYAMGLSEDYGSIARGKKAIFYHQTDPVLSYLPYAFGEIKWKR